MRVDCGDRRGWIFSPAFRMILREGKQGARAVGLDDWQQHTLIAMFQYYELYGFGGNPRVLNGVLGREPTTFEGCM